ncbi:MAG: sigma-54-dependent Fis family transcriptional regulator [Pirellulales bacterium]|nr:sigma-54-dependent Fis family transcriptional regulator [Pirellulales bacterium]
MIVRIILATDTASSQSRFQQLIDQNDALVVASKTGENLWEAVSSENYDLLFVSLPLLGVPASETVSSLRAMPDSPDVVVLCDEEDPQQRAELLAAGCLSVLFTGLSNQMLEEAILAILERRRQTAEESLLPVDVAPQPQLSDFISASPAMETFMNVVHRVVASDATLLIMGETGVGKERLARAIHADSPRSTGPFISVNCGALSETLLESELFGHEEGAFTGASRARRGYFELAHNGTVFLDEIGEMPKHLQVKLLTVLQTREVQRVGAETPVSVDVRIVAATNRDLHEEVEAGSFRRDLFYRLSVVTLTIPPLRNRREDIPLFVQRTLEHYRSEIPRNITGVSTEAMHALSKYDWPGNVRELMNVMERAMLLAEGEKISTIDLPVNISGLNPTVSPAFPTPESVDDEELRVPKQWLDLPLREARAKLLADFERAYLAELLAATGGRIGKTAQRAGIQPRSLYDKMKHFGLRKEDYRS